MARKKSPWRAWLSTRRIRWMVARLAARLSPTLAARLNFPANSVRAVDCAAIVIEDARVDLALAHSPAEARDILAPAAANDTGKTSQTPAGLGAMRYQSAIIEDCAILGHTGSIVREADFALVNLDGAAGNWNFARPALLKARPAPEHPCIVLHGAGHYYHFFANGVLPLLRRLQLRPPQTPLGLIAAARPTPFEQAVLGALTRAFPQLRLEPLGRDEKLTRARVEWLFALADNYEWAPASRPLADRLLAMLLDHWDDDAPLARPDHPGPLVYIDRGEAKLRRMRDDEAVRAALTRHGFRPFIAHAGNFRAQVETMAQARTVVAVHGAGLTNLLFCRPGATVVEIFPSNFVKSTYFWLARQLGLDYRYLIGGPGDYDQTFTAGADRLEALLAQIGETDGPDAKAP